MTTQTEGVKAGHTKGPWSLGAEPYHDHVFGPDGFEIAETPTSCAIHRDYFEGRMGGHWGTTPGAHREVRDGETEANARLIAAAPDLLEAIDPDALDVSADQCQRAGLGAVATALRMMAENQRAAIAKATGQ